MVNFDNRESFLIDVNHKLDNHMIPYDSLGGGEGEIPVRPPSVSHPAQGTLPAPHTCRLVFSTFYRRKCVKSEPRTDPVLPTTHDDAHIKTGLTLLMLK